MERLHKNKRILDKEILVLEEKGWVGGKKGNLETDETNTIEKKLILDLADVEMIGPT